MHRYVGPAPVFCPSSCASLPTDVSIGKKTHLFLPETGGDEADVTPVPSQEREEAEATEAMDAEPTLVAVASPTAPTVARVVRTIIAPSLLATPSQFCLLLVICMMIHVIRVFVPH